MTAKTPQDMIYMMRKLKQEIGFDLNCVKLGRVTKCHADGSVDVILQDKMELENGKIVERSMLINCPQMVYSGGGAGITMPDPTGSGCVVFFADSDIDNWWINDNPSVPNTGRTHHVNDGIVFVGVHNSSGIPNFDKTSLTIHFGGKKIKLSDSEIVIDQGSKKITVSDSEVEIDKVKIKDDDVIFMGGISLTEFYTKYLAHIHGGVMPGNGKTTPPEGA